MPKGIVVRIGVFEVCHCGKEFRATTHKEIAPLRKLHYKKHPECNRDAVRVHAGSVREDNGRNGNLLINRDAEIRNHLLLQ